MDFFSNKQKVRWLNFPKLGCFNKSYVKKLRPPTGISCQFYLTRNYKDYAWIGGWKVALAYDPN